MPILRPASRLGPYEIVEMLRMGGMSCIYLAKWLPAEGNPPVFLAVKVANTAADVPHKSNQPAEDLESFYYESLNNEVEILKRLHHPGIVRLYPVPWGIKKDPYIVRATNVGGAPWFFAMEYLEGGSVAQLMEQGTVEPKLAVEIAYQVTQALDYMHAKGYAHLDVKPDNILLRRQTGPDSGAGPQAVLTDFGIAQRHQQAAPEAGSLPYTAPELVAVMTGAVAPELIVDGPPVDIYGIGVLLYQMLTGHLPFGAQDDMGVTTAILKGEPTKPSVYVPELAGPIEDLILKTLRREPAARPKADELVRLLDSALSPRRFDAETALPRPAANPRPPATMWFFAGTTLLLAAVVLAQLMFWGPLRPLRMIGPSPVPTIAATAAPTKTSVPSRAPTATARPTGTPPPSPSPTKAATFTALPPTEAPAVLPTSTPVNTRTATPSRTPLPTATATATPTPSALPSLLETRTPMATETATASASLLETRTPQGMPTRATLGIRTPLAPAEPPTP
jgi:serine/threonine-protein kinase